MGELASNRPAYVAVWRQVLRGWLGWPAEQFDAWVARFDADLNDEGNPFFYHEDELYYVVPQLIPPDLAERLIWVRSKKSYSAYGGLIDELYDAIPTGWETPHYDWDAARGRVDAVLRRWGTQLPDPTPA